MRIPLDRQDVNEALRGLAWHTDDATLRQKFEEFGQVEEAVSIPRSFLRSFHTHTTTGCREGSRHWPKPWLWLRPLQPGL